MTKSTRQGRRGFLGGAAAGSMAAAGAVFVGPREANASPPPLPLDPAFYGATKIIMSRPMISGSSGLQTFAVVNIPKEFLAGQTIIRIHVTLQFLDVATANFVVQHGRQGEPALADPYVISMGGLNGANVLAMKGEIAMSSPTNQITYGYNSATGMGFLGNQNLWQSHLNYADSGMDIRFTGQLGGGVGQITLMSGFIEIFKDYPAEPNRGLQQ